MSDELQRSSGSGAQLGAATGGIGAALAALAASACCVGPLMVSVLGVGGAVAAAGLAPYRPYLLMLSVGSIGAGFWLAYRPARRGGAACSPTTGRFVRPVLWGAAALTLFAFAVPYLVELA